MLGVQYSGKSINCRLSNKTMSNSPGKEKTELIRQRFQIINFVTSIKMGYFESFSFILLSCQQKFEVQNVQRFSLWRKEII